MILYHRTNAADAIMRDGFRDATGSYGLVGLTLLGVFLSDVPLDHNEGAKGDQVLQVTLPDSLDLADYELIEEEKPYREWCVPAELITRHGTVTLVD